ncbi:hypothetical protein AVEN_50108-1 [Araneus ventricosus]|uniref:Uncharacterized protein n=1 Tax=Araneus ventricosus TaxID=182803 RepID=A0A4Y2FNZ2_ARAVE|nr:hypothetical protein AVEN_50108-1 [Araneus ventricosus]
MIDVLSAGLRQQLQTPAFPSSEVHISAVTEFLNQDVNSWQANHMQGCDHMEDRRRLCHRDRRSGNAQERRGQNQVTVSKFKKQAVHKSVTDITSYAVSPPACGRPYTLLGRLGRRRL